MAEQFGIDIGLMILMGIAVGLPTSVVGLLVCRVLDRFSPIPMRSYAGEPEAEPLEDKDLPPLSLSLLPVLLPVVLISANTIAKAVAGAPTQAAEAGQAAVAVATAQQVADVTAVLGNPNLALLLSAAIAMTLVVWKRGLTLRDLAGKVDKALMSGGIIILITAAGGAFGAMLRAAGVQTAVKDMLDTVGPNAGLMILLLGFGMSVLIKFAQGSGTVAMITTASMFAAMGISSEMLGCHPVYLAMAIGSGSLVGDWMNNSGFWIFARMSVLTETETLKTWTILTAALGVAGLVFTLALAAVLPLV
jgi:GntP family gluconate:H+ symporter